MFFVWIYGARFPNPSWTLPRHLTPSSCTRWEGRVSTEEVTRLPKFQGPRIAGSLVREHSPPTLASYCHGPCQLEGGRREYSISWKSREQCCQLGSSVNFRLLVLPWCQVLLETFAKAQDGSVR